MKTNILFTLLTIITTSIVVNAQDLIYKKNKEVIVAKILEVGVDEIKYKEFANQEGPTFAIDKNEVARIKYENGKTVIVNDNMSNPDMYADNKKNAVKMDFLSPMFGQTTIGYERSLKPGASIEFQLGLIGLGVNNYSSFGGSCSGAFVRVGYKFIKSPDFYSKGMRYAHILKGSYFKPEITFGQCKENFQSRNYSSSSGNNYSISNDASFGAIMLNFGKQWVMNDFFVVDYYFGFGYGFKSNNTDFINAGIDKNVYWGNSHAFLGPYGGFPLAYGAGLKVGILLK